MSHKLTREDAEKVLKALFDGYNYLGMFHAELGDMLKYPPQRMEGVLCRVTSDRKEVENAIKIMQSAIEGMK